MITAHKVPVKVAGYYGSVVPDNDEGIDAFLLFEDLSSCESPTLHPGLTAGQLREVFLSLEAFSHKCAILLSWQKRLPTSKPGQ